MNKTMKNKTFNSLYDVMQSLIDIYLADDNKATRRKVNRLIKSINKILEDSLNNK